MNVFLQDEGEVLLHETPPSQEVQSPLSNVIYVEDLTLKNQDTSHSL